MKTSKTVEISGSLVSILHFECLNAYHQGNIDGIFVGNLEIRNTNVMNDGEEHEESILRIHITRFMICEKFYNNFGTINKADLCKYKVHENEQILGFFRYRSNCDQPSIRDSVLACNFQEIYPNSVFALFSSQVDDDIYAQTFTFYEVKENQLHKLKSMITNLNPPIPFFQTGMADTNDAGKNYVQHCKINFDVALSKFQNQLEVYLANENTINESKYDIWKSKST